MSGYTPTTENVRYGYVANSSEMRSDKKLYEEFDRWLAKVKQEAIADWQLERLAATIEATREDYTMGENK